MHVMIVKWKKLKFDELLDELFSPARIFWEFCSVFISLVQELADYFLITNIRFSKENFCASKNVNLIWMHAGLGVGKYNQMKFE